MNRDELLKMLDLAGNERIKALKLSSEEMADFHAAAFEPCPQLQERRIDRRRLELLTQLLGYDDAQVERLAESGAIGRAKASAD